MSTESGLDLGVDIMINDVGDLALDETPQDDEHISSEIADALQQTETPLLLDGDHSITFTIIQAIAKHYKNIQILHFDAHPDLYDDFDGNPRSHASPFARIMENGLAARLVQVGVRTVNRHQRQQAERFSVEMVRCMTLSRRRFPQSLDRYK